MKTINESKMQIVFDLTNEGGIIKVKGSAHCEISSEGISTRRGYPFTLTPIQETAIKNLSQSVLAMIKTNEGI